MMAAGVITMGLFGKDEPETATVLGKPLECQVCANDLFWQKEVVMHDSVVGHGWASPPATLLVCNACGYVHWFLTEIG